VISSGEGPALPALASFLARAGASQGSFADLLTRRLLPLVAGLLLTLVVFQQLQRARALRQGLVAVRRYGIGRRVQAAVVGVGYPVLLVALGAVLFSSEASLVLKPSQAAASSAAGSRSAVQPSPRPQALLAPDPQAVILQAADLQGGFHVQRAKPVAFVSAGDSFPSWDVVYEPNSAAQRGEYLLAESLVVVFSNVPQAAGAWEARVASDRASHAEEYVPLSKVGDQVAVWIEKTANSQDYVVVRVTWRYVNIVNEIAILAPASSAKPEHALQLARVQQERLKTVAPPVQTLPTQHPA
jgi:hypothetical protein